MKTKFRTNKKSKELLYRILSVLLTVISAIFIITLLYIDLLPTKYLTTIVLSILIFDIFTIFLISLKRLKLKVKKILALFMFLAISIMSIASFYTGKTLGIFINNGDSKYKLEYYSVVVLKSSNYNSLSDIKNKDIGYFENSKGSDQANDRLLKEVKVNFSSYKSSDDLINDLFNSKLDAVIIENSIKSIVEEEIENFSDKAEVIYTFKVKIESEISLKDVEVTKEPFAIYISGIDTYGEIASVSRSDVNIVMIVNPKINQILLISIPRDYYVQLHGTSGSKDKLTHAGIYGIDMSIKTIEDLLQLEINYYIKVNFTSVIDIVNALGGVDVYSEYTFISYSNFSFKKGMNYVNGEQALDFARTRKAFKDGDRQRGKNQQALIEALVRKLTNKSVITKYNSLLDAVNGKYQTNMSLKKITSLIKMQLEEMKPWTINSYSLTGYDSKDYTYTYNKPLYVMKPNNESITEAINLINKILENSELENSYNNLGSESNKVVKSSKEPTTAQTTNPQKKELKDLVEEKQKDKEENNNTTDDDKKEDNSVGESINNELSDLNSSDQTSMDKENDDDNSKIE